MVREICNYKSTIVIITNHKINSVITIVTFVKNPAASMLWTLNYLGKICFKILYETDQCFSKNSLRELPIKSTK